MRRLLFLATVAAAVVLTACGTRRPPDGIPVSPPPGEHRDSPVIAVQDKPVSVAEQLKGQTGVVTLTMTERGFVPNRLTTTVGGRVKIYLRNEDRQEHNLVIDRFGVVTRTMPPGNENYVEFTANEKGEWPFVSDAPGPVEEQFRGVLKVE
ncbi:MAG TPA: cupredoxin domain-containing protein [Symbiobacteriaceae bacterium]|nr:cupredoxin domain-containing protein [Symbiobacteriaceae bacterium]